MARRTLGAQRSVPHNGRSTRLFRGVTTRAHYARMGPFEGEAGARMVVLRDLVRPRVMTRVAAGAAELIAMRIVLAVARRAGFARRQRVVESFQLERGCLVAGFAGPLAEPLAVRAVLLVARDALPVRDTERCFAGARVGAVACRAGNRDVSAG